MHPGITLLMVILELVVDIMYWFVKHLSVT